MYVDMYNIQRIVFRSNTLSIKAILLFQYFFFYLEKKFY